MKFINANKLLRKSGAWGTWAWGQQQLPLRVVSDNIYSVN
jgi:hypothetical protein